ncbi:hypothetical protein L6452_28023 [Arctium lappa]|uniref:Uncharacterized protein n=1 Tax=Arctium lappa TaxID=4217 RepID=A0ACB8ZXA9_ARCLA|nr:hypothetical protein L6452_28023 [Arctium lappa]
MNRIARFPLAFVSVRTLVSDRGSGCLKLRCEVASDSDCRSVSNSSSLSALELLKTSATESEYLLSQVKHVVKVGQGVPGFDRKISGLFKHAITVGKRVRSSVSVSSAAVLAQMKIPDHFYAFVNVLVVGAGKMGKLVIKHLIAN